MPVVETAPAVATAVAEAAAPAEAVAVAAEAAAAAAPVYLVARCDIRRQIRRQSQHRQPRAIHVVAAVTETAVAAIGDNIREGNG